jgi:hypothetical protein
MVPDHSSVSIEWGTAMGIKQRIAAKGVGRTLLAVPRRAQRDVLGLVRPKPYDPKHPVPSSREVPPATGVTEAGEPVWSPKHGGTSAGDVAGQIKAYASANSVNLGEGIDFHVSVNPAQTFTVEIYRVGAKDECVLTSQAVDGVTQAAPTLLKATRTVVCDWSPSWRLEVPRDWRSGVFVAKLRNEQGFQTCVPFVVRDDAVAAEVLVALPFPTYQAYNEYPKDKNTGASLYYAWEDGKIYTEDKAATAVSFDRPYHVTGVPANFDLDASFAAWVERWAEETGHSVGYADSADLHHGVVDPTRHKALILPGHDEYWSQEMRQALDNAVDAGVSVAFLAANNVYWRIRLEASGDGRPYRTVTCYKNRSDPGAASKSERTTQWRKLRRPEQAVLGAQYVSTLKGTAPLVVDNAGHWFWSGTGVRDGERIEELLWGECDQVTPWTPKPDGVEILAASPYVGQGQPRTQHTVLHRTAAGGWVFDGGTFHWAKGLSAPGIADSRIQRATANLLERMLKG